jgi:hypothetical protein
MYSFTTVQGVSGESDGDAVLRYRSSLAVKLALAKGEIGAISPVM